MLQQWDGAKYLALVERKESPYKGQTMLKFFESRALLQNLASWADTTDVKLRGWWHKQSEDLLASFMPSPSQWGTAALEQARALDIDWPRLSQLKTNIHKSTFDAKVKAGESLYSTYTKAARKWLGAELREVELTAGRIHYWTTSSNHPETILFIHGFGDSKDGAYSLAFHLAKQFNVIALDLPGFGQSFRDPELCYDTHSYGRWLDEFMTKARIGPVHVVGNSLGGAMALKLALVRPDVIKSLCLLNTAAIIDFKHHSIYDDILRGEILFQVQTFEQFEKFWSTVFHRRPFLPPFVKEYFFHTFRENHDWYGQLVRQNFGGYASKKDPRYKKLFMNEHLRKIEAPTLIIWGDRDQLFPVAYGEKGHKLLKDARFLVLSDVGHAPQVEVPEEVARHLKQFIAGLSASQDQSSVQ